MIGMSASELVRRDEFDLDPRLGCLQCSQHRGQQVARSNLAGRDAHGAAGTDALLRQALLQLFGTALHCAGVAGDCQRQRCGRDATAGTFEQRCPELRLEGGDLPR
jgi:hypothetical protein